MLQLVMFALVGQLLQEGDTAGVTPTHPDPAQSAHRSDEGDALGIGSGPGHELGISDRLVPLPPLMRYAGKP